MSMQSLIMSNRRVTNFVMSRMPASIWKRIGKSKALKVFKLASQTVPAYRKLINNCLPSTTKISSVDDFNKLPIIDKKNYINKYPLIERIIGGKMTGKYTVEKSASTTGGSYFWPRLPEEDEMFPKYIEYSFVQFYSIDKKSTLVIMTLALGTWTSGEKMAQALRLTATSNKNYKMTVVTPGANAEEVIEIVKNLSDQYDQTVIVGYPPFVKTVIDEGEKEGIDWRSLNLRLGLGGEGYSEKWREYMAEKIGLPKNDLMGIAGGYGAADIGMTIGREYPITILIRKLACRDKKLAKALFGTSELQPSFLQYNPSGCYIEEINNELVFTVLSGVPLVRYNIHDRGGVKSFEKVMKIAKNHGYNIEKELKKFGYTPEDVWHLPFFYVFGRSDGTISVGGANIYPENVDTALYTPQTTMINAYKLTTITDKEMNTRPAILIELDKNYKFVTKDEIKDLKNKLHDIFMKSMMEMNGDFRDAFRVDPKCLNLIIKVYPYNSAPFIEDKKKIKRKYILEKTAV